MAGTKNDTLVGKNADFSQAGAPNATSGEANGLNTNGQIWIGSTATNAGGTHINVGSITSPDSSVTIGYSSPNITLQVAGGGAIETINGDSGSIAGSTVTIYANNAANNAGATVEFVNSGTTSTLSVSDGVANCLIGRNAGNLTLTGIANTGLGQACLNGLTSGVQNTAVGNGALLGCTSGGGNTSIGYLALATATSGSQNTAIGWSSLGSCDANNNTAIGFQTLANLTTGASNIAIGQGTGGSCTGGSSGNILIDNAGAAESNTIRIGNVQTRCFIKGISGVTVAASVAVLIDANGQMGTILSSERYKENIHNVPKDLSILNLRPVSFNYKSDENKTTQYGLIAEEVAKDFPYLAIYKDGQPETVKYHELCVFLLAEIQRLEKRVNVLEAK